MRNIDYNTGDRFGYLSLINKVDRPIESKSKRNSFWLCECVCGKKIVRDATSLRFSNNSSCGCKNNNKLKDLTGQRFGRLVVLSRDIDKERKENRKGASWKCKCDCGKETSASCGSLLSGTTKSCGCYAIEYNKTRVGELSSVWKGGTTYSQGYRLVLNPKHPNANKKGYVREHVLKMSEHIGRPLLEGETVHHKDGNRCNNDIKNLELWSKNHPSGQRVQDLVEYAWAIVNLYDPMHTRTYKSP